MVYLLSALAKRKNLNAQLTFKKRAENGVYAKAMKSIMSL